EPDQLKDGEGAKDGEVPFLATFDNSYHRELALLPQDAWPQSAKHGRHSYTVKLCDTKARVEVLLRQLAFRPKTDVNGQKIEGT
ncbi:unnamed protein product, partial [Effrenium voratum]